MDKIVQQTVVVVQTATPVPATATATAKPKTAVTWRIGMPSDITSTNIWHILGPGSTAYNFYTQTNQYPSMMGLSDQRFDYVPVMAADFPSPVKAEGAVFTTTIKMRKGVKWSDGTDITAADFVFTVNTSKEFELPGGWASNIPPALVLKAEAVDPLTVKITFARQPGLAEWQYGLSQQLFVQEKFWKPKIEEARKAADIAEKRKALFAAKSAGEPVAGEMIFKKWETGAFVEISKNSNYFWAGSTATNYKSGGYDEKTATDTITVGAATGDATLAVKRVQSADNVVFSVFATQDAAILAIQKGEIDYYLSPLGLAAGLRSQVQGKPNLGSFQNPQNGIRYMGFNTRKAPFNDQVFRTAIATLIDKEFLTATVLQNVAIPIYTIVPEGNGFWWNPNVSLPGKGQTRQQRIEAVVKLMKAAGYTWATEPTWNTVDRKVNAGAGLKDKAGKAIAEIELLAPSAGYDPLRATAAIWIEQWLKEAGIPVKANLTGFNVIVDRVFEKQEFDMWILGYGLTIYPDYIADFFLSENAVLGGDNSTGYSNPEFDKLAKEFKAETDLNKARDLAFKLQVSIADANAFVMLYSTPVFEVYRNDRVNFAYTNVLDGVQNFFSGMNGPLAATQVN